MDKQKILYIAQSKKEDERYTYISVKGALISLFITMAVVLSILIFKSIKGDNVTDLGLIIISQVIGFSVYQYIRLPEKKIYLVIISISLLFFSFILVIFLASYGVV